MRCGLPKNGRHEDRDNSVGANLEDSSLTADRPDTSSRSAAATSANVDEESFPILTHQANGTNETQKETLETGVTQTKYSGKAPDTIKEDNFDVINLKGKDNSNIKYGLEVTGEELSDVIEEGVAENVEVDNSKESRKLVKEDFRKASSFLKCLEDAKSPIIKEQENGTVKNNQDNEQNIEDAKTACKQPLFPRSFCLPDLLSPMPLTPNISSLELKDITDQIDNVHPNLVNCSNKQSGENHKLPPPTVPKQTTPNKLVRVEQLPPGLVPCPPPTEGPLSPEQFKVTQPFHPRMVFSSPEHISKVSDSDSPRNDAF